MSPWTDGAGVDIGVSGDIGSFSMRRNTSHAHIGRAVGITMCAEESGSLKGEWPSVMDSHVTPIF